MDYWSWHTDLSLLGEDEVMIVSQTGAALYDGDKKTQWKKGKIMLTTHRLLYQDLAGVGGGSTLQLQLADVAKAGSSPSSTSGFAFSSDKIVLPLPAGKYSRIAFRSGGMREFYDALIKALKAQAWHCVPPPPAIASEASLGASAATADTVSRGRDPSDTFGAAASMAGIAGVMRVSEQRSRMQETFKDIDDVMAKASSLVANIRQLKDRATASDRTAQDEVAIESIEATLGLGTMVTTTSASSSSGSASAGVGKLGSQKHFHEELGAELHAWMTHPRNERVFGEMTFVPLIELFSMYNRARSGDLVSPADVLHACKAMTRGGSSAYSLEELSSGRMALVSRDDTIVLAKLVTLLGPMLASRAHAKICHVPSGRKTIPTTDSLPTAAVLLRAVNEVQLASALRVAVPVARDALDKLTSQGYLCKCEAGYGCAMYYWNIFAI